MELVARVPKDGELGGGVFVAAEESVCMYRYVIVQVAKAELSKIMHQVYLTTCTCF